MTHGTPTSPMCGYVASMDRKLAQNPTTFRMLKPRHTASNGFKMASTQPNSYDFLRRCGPTRGLARPQVCGMKAGMWRLPVASRQRRLVSSSFDFFTFFCILKLQPSGLKKIQCACLKKLSQRGTNVFVHVLGKILKHQPNTSFDTDQAVPSGGLPEVQLAVRNFLLFCAGLRPI